MNLEFQLSDQIDWEGLKRQFEPSGRVEIPALLSEGQAQALRDHLVSRDDWKLVLNSGNNVYELTQQDYAALSDETRAELDRHVVAAGRDGFHYRYRSIRAPDGGDAAGTLLDRFIAFLSSPPLLAALNNLIGCDDVAFADGQATSYAEGHFLTAHYDDVPGKVRRAAYVFSLTPDWRPEWGGVLMFHGSDGRIDEGFAPRFGALRLFRVPQLHSVSYVTPFAPEPRLSITGWLRADS